MVRVMPGAETLTCKQCGVFENGTITGIHAVTDPNPYQLGADMKVDFIDHGGVLRFPSPDSEGYEPVRVAEQTAQ